MKATYGLSIAQLADGTVRVDPLQAGTLFERVPDVAETKELVVKAAHQLGSRGIPLMAEVEAEGLIVSNMGAIVSSMKDHEYVRVPLSRLRALQAAMDRPMGGKRP